MKLNEVYDLIKKFESSNLCEMNLEFDSTKLHLKKDSPENGHSAKTIIQTVPSIFGHDLPEKNVLEEDKDIICIKAPLVGTFYRGTSPEEQPYIKVGQQVKKGDIVGIIDAMKLMNEVSAPFDGIIVEILAEDDSLVQYDQILIKMKESCNV